MNRRNFIRTITLISAGLVITPTAIIKPYTIWDILDLEGWRYRRKINGIGSMYQLWHPEQCLTGRLWCWDMNPMTLYIDVEVPVKIPLYYDFTSNTTQELHKALREAKKVEGWSGISRCMRDKGYQLEKYNSALKETTLFFESVTQGKIMVIYYNNPVKAPGRTDYTAHWYFSHTALNGYTYNTGWSESASGPITWFG
jgi:hypothetical protein